ncbi:type II secretion system protein GspE [Candidatus Peregrinibacteria bacterium]|nr:type II secretion system protein GspE [Candidatus Peregrinibacteria bacterium]
MADQIDYKNPGNQSADNGNSQQVGSDSGSIQQTQNNQTPATTPPPATMPQKEDLSNNLQKIQREQKEKATMEKAQKMNMNYVDIASTPINPDLLKLIPPEIAKKNLIIPFYKLGKKIRVTVAHPTDPETRNVIKGLKDAGFLININLSSDEGILEALKLYESDQYVVKKEIDTKVDEENLKTYEKELEALNQMGEKLKNVNSEEAVYMICVGALKAGSSDIHLEAEETFVRCRYRIDGVLHEVFRIDKATFEHISSQLKYQSKLKVNIDDIPQDGRFFFKVNERKVDVRVSTLPTEYGESFVLRLLDSGRHLVTFEELGYSGQYLRKIKNLGDLSHGMILMTGPTGSGKTTSLYTILSQFNKPGSKVITLEDPIEYHLEGIAQSQINEKGGYTFSSGLRSILRQDPEVIMIGEIRDKATAETAAQAALTGHVLLSTLHTNSAIESIPRLINIGLPPFMIAPSLHTIIAQRLVRKICPHCSKQQPVSESEKNELEQVIKAIKSVRPSMELTIPPTLPEADGCDECSHSGYKGRVCIVEMLEVDFEMKDLILNKASTTKMIESARRKGMITMREDGIIKVLEGVTTLEEVHRVTAIK